MEEQKAYITFANAKRLIHSLITPSGHLSGEKLFDYIFDTDLSNIISEKDARDLYKLKLLSEGSDVPTSFKIKNIENFKNRTLIFSNTSPPKYHLSDSCQFLNSDYINYKIPQSIKDRSPEEIEEFIKFCTPNRKIIEDQDISFILLINEKFKTNINSFDEFVLPNSGTTDIKSMDLTELQIFIHLSLNRCIEILRDNKDNKSLQNHYKYKSVTNNDLHSSIEDITKEYIANKLNIIEGLRNLYYKSNGNKASTTTYILDLAGFEKCRSCSK